MGERTYRFADLHLDTALRSLSRVEEGELVPVKIGARALEVLLVLLARRGEVASKQEIMAAVWPGIAVEENNLTVQIAALRRVLDRGREESLIQNIPGRGYRLAGAVEVIESTARDDATAPVRPARHFRVRALVAAVSATALVAGGLAIAAARSGWLFAWSAPPPLSVAVLPIEAVVAEPAETRLAIAYNDALVADLHRIPNAEVIGGIASGPGRNRAGRAVRRMLAEHRVRYILGGYASPAGENIMMHAWLLEADTGVLIAANQGSFSRADQARDVLVRQRQLERPLLTALVDDAARRVETRPDASHTAAGLLLEAEAVIRHPLTEADAARAAALLRKALILDPASIQAKLMLIKLWSQPALRVGFDDIVPPRVPDLERLLVDVRASTPGVPEVVKGQASLLLLEGRFDEAAMMYRRLLHSHPNSFHFNASLGIAEMGLGHPDAALPMLDKALALDPDHPEVFAVAAQRGRALFLLGRYAEALESLREADQQSPVELPILHAWLAATLAHLGRLEEARTELAALARDRPQETADTLRHSLLTHGLSTVEADRLAAALAQAGLRG